MRTHLEIHDREEFCAHVAVATSMRGWFVQSVDLRGLGEQLTALDPTGAVFLGCRFDPAMAERLTERGALVFPALPGLPFDPYRSGLYTARELYSCPQGRPRAYVETADGQIHGWYTALGDHPDIAAELAMTLHDHAIGDALDEVPAARSRTVGIMGGHAVERGTARYADAARLARALARAGRTVVTGGGPGAMEAANLGASLAGHPDDALPTALDMVAQVPGFGGGVDRWAAVALAVTDRWPAGEAGRSVGVPTWFYGHEPPNVFATDIAKYFNNAIREDALLSRCGGGIVVLPGAAGTTQEIFQATTANYYAPDPTCVVPLVLVESAHWVDELPAWPLLTALGRGRAMGDHLHLVERVDDALALLLG